MNTRLCRNANFSALKASCGFQRTNKCLVHNNFTANQFFELVVSSVPREYQILAGLVAQHCEISCTSIGYVCHEVLHEFELFIFCDDLLKGLQCSVWQAYHSLTFFILFFLTNFDCDVLVGSSVDVDVPLPKQILVFIHLGHR